MNFFKLLWSFLTEPSDWLELLEQSRSVLDTTDTKTVKKNRTMWG